MKTLLASAMCGALLMGGAAASAQSATGTVVELYTSQGCSSCPPADAYLTQLAREPGVIALALHVDYWDYIGWKDKFGHSAFSDRQRAYARVAGSRSIYTPQMVIGGVDEAVGSNPDRVSGIIRRHQSADPMVVLQLMRSGNSVKIHAEPKVALDEDLMVQLVRFHPSEHVAIKRGENAGHTIEYSNIVTSWKVVGMWDGRGELDLNVPAAGADKVVVILQAEGPGMIFAAAQLD
jgi:hypothetical protein